MSEAKVRALIAAQKTLMMATTGKDGVPTASYAPFVYHNNCFYVCTSNLSRHTKDLLERGAASILFIEDENGASNLFARKRLTLSCMAEVVWLFEGSKGCSIVDLFQAKFKKAFTLIRSLPGFMLFRLTPRDGLAVLGFGEAYRVDATLERLEHITGPGHRT